ncbi:MAG: 50S ribosomal protein L32e [Candidatus Hadarchaeota archaeon]
MKKKPNFRRESWFGPERLGEKWRKPHGRESRTRLRMKGKGALVSIGYGSPASSRGLHPSGLSEVLVHNQKELEKVNPQREVARIASGVGAKTRETIIVKAKELKVRVLNPVVKHEAEQKETTGV